MHQKMNDLESRLRKVELTPSPELDKAVAQLAAEEERRDAEASSRHTLRLGRRGWMAAMAAMLLMAFGLAVLLWPQKMGNVLVSSTYAHMQEAMSNVGKADWVHFATSIGERKQEMWISFPMKEAYIKDGNTVLYLNGANKQQWQYDAGKNEIAITEQAFPFGDANSLLEMFTTQMKDAQAEGEVVVSETNEIVNGREVRIMHLTSKNPPGHTGRIAIDAAMKRVVFAEIRNEETIKAGMGTVRIDLEYPEKGPANIYALGVPRDAKILNEQPDMNVVKLREQMEQAIKRFPDYSAITCKARIEKNDALNATGVSVAHKKNGAYRIEAIQPEFDQQHGRFLAPFDALDTFHEWVKNRPRIFVSFFPADKERGTRIAMSKPGELTQERDNRIGSPQGTPEHEIWNSITVLSQSEFTVYDLLPEEKGPNGRLVVIEKRSQARVRKGIIDRPTKIRAWFNADRDWIVERVEMIQDPDAPWQEVKDWYKDLKETERPHYWAYTRSVQEYTKTGDGHWYPSRILQTQESENIDSEGLPKRTTSLHAILLYVDTDSEIPDALMDPASVTPEMFDQEAAKRQETFDNDILRICAEKSWPATAEEVAQAYLDAGAAGDWDRVALLQPGWALRYPDGLTKPGIEYVLGKGRNTGADQITFQIKPKDPNADTRGYITYVTVRKSFTKEANRYYIESGPY